VQARYYNTLSKEQYLAKIIYARGFISETFVLFAFVPLPGSNYVIFIFFIQRLQNVEGSSNHVAQ